jgi:hypothetical protein
MYIAESTAQVIVHKIDANELRKDVKAEQLYEDWRSTA